MNYDHIAKTLTNAKFWFAAWKKDKDAGLALKIKECVSAIARMLENLCLSGFSLIERAEIASIRKDVTVIETAMA